MRPGLIGVCLFALALLNGCASVQDNPITAFPIMVADTALKPLKPILPKRAPAPAPPAAPAPTASQAPGNVPGIWPVSHPEMYLSSGFGIRGATGGVGRFHKGVDLVCPKGTPIVATADGEVTYAKTMSGYGNLVIIKHSETHATYYAHMDTIKATVGQRVSRGQQIGTVGRTGRASVEHCHYEIRVAGKAVDPEQFLPGADKVTRKYLAGPAN